MCPLSYRVRSLIATPFALLLTACTTYFYPAYSIALTEVTRPSSAQQRYGPQTITQVKDSAGRYHFEDALISATFFVDPYRVRVTLDNKTEYPIQIAWDNAAFVGPLGRSEPMIHENVGVGECGTPKAPSIIVAHGRLVDALIPCSSLVLRTEGLSAVRTWHVDGYLPAGVYMASSNRAASDTVSGMAGRQLQLLLPIRVQDVVNDYTFTFRIVTAAMIQGTPPPTP